MRLLWSRAFYVRRIGAVCRAAGGIVLCPWISRGSSRWRGDPAGRPSWLNLPGHGPRVMDLLRARGGARGRCGGDRCGRCCGWCGGCHPVTGGAGGSPAGSAAGAPGALVTRSCPGSGWMSAGRSGAGDAGQPGRPQPGSDPWTAGADADGACGPIRATVICGLCRGSEAPDVRPAVTHQRARSGLADRPDDLYEGLCAVAATAQGPLAPGGPFLPGAQ